VVSGDIGRGSGAVGARAELYRRVISPGVAVSSEVALDQVLERIVRAGCELTGGRYGAMGVLDPSRSEYYRITQEALTNSIKYAHAAHISITILHGRGFSPPDTPAHGLGLGGMHDRVSILGGHLDIHSALNAGTTIRARIPIDRSDQEAVRAR
jgi:signal transduction histidine kinase